MIRLKYYIIFSLFLIATVLHAQQLPVYSQYVFNDYLINPAVAGTEDYTPLRLSYRDQWSGFSNDKGDAVAPKTFTVSAHTPITDNIAIGGFVYSDQTGPISQTAAQMSFGWRTCLSKESCFWERKKFMSLSYGARVVQWAYDDTKTTSWNEYFGWADDPVLPNTIETSFALSHTVATYFYTEYVYMGFSAQNLFSQPLGIETLSSFDNILTPEYNFMAGAYLPLSQDKSLAFEPSILSKTTSWSGTQFDVGARFIYTDKIWAGFSYRTSEQAYALLFGLEAGSGLFLGYCYDTAVEGIDGYSGGTHELAIGINLSTLGSVNNVRLKSRFKNRRMLLNPFKRDRNRTDRRGSGS